MRKIASILVAMVWLSHTPAALYAAPKSDVKFETQAKPISINKASLEELQTLRGIGPSLAGHIVKYREEHGRFEKVEDFSQVKGIGQAKFEKLKAQLTL